MKKTAMKIVMSVAVAACVGMAKAQWTSFQSQTANGPSAGSSYRPGGTTYYNNANGTSAGSSYRSGNTTYYYNANGSSAGSATTIGR